MNSHKLETINKRLYECLSSVPIQEVKSIGFHIMAWLHSWLNSLNNAIITTVPFIPQTLTFQFICNLLLQLNISLVINDNAFDSKRKCEGMDG